MPERLKLTKNAQFFEAKAPIVDAMISAVLDAAVQNQENGADLVIDTLRAERVSASGHRYLLSARVFPTARGVYFIEDDLTDSIYAFIVLIEFGSHMVLLKKSCGNVAEILDEYFNLIDGAQLASTFDDDDVEYQKIALRNMTVSDRAMRARSFEAVDLKGLFSTHAAGRSIPYFLKIRQGAILKTLSAGTGRLVETSERKSIDEIADWAYEQICLLQGPAANKAFLDSFARLASLDSVLQVATPSAILVESGILVERLESDQIELRYKTQGGIYIGLSKRRIGSLMSMLEKVCEIDGNLLIDGLGQGARIRKNAKSLTLHSPMLKKKIWVEEFGELISLQKYLTKHGLYSICFSDPKYMYFMGRCFVDASGVSEIDSILDLLIPCSSLGMVTSEKGTLVASSNSFPMDSVFGVVETLHASDDYMFCDDLGNEWADHIMLNRSESSITFVHSKHGDSTVSAGRMHEVVGQGVKNLGHMFFTKAQIAKKLREKFQDVYKLDGVVTSINRVRLGNVANFDRFITDLQGDYRLHRKCVLACSFLSKTEVAAEFAKIKAGQPVAGHVIQLLWIISSFAHAAKDANVIPLIYCRD